MSLVTCCRDATGLLTEASEDALTGFERVTFALHMTVCPHCRRYREQLGTTVEVLRAMAPKKEAAPPGDVEAILRRIAEEPPDE